jgi:cob(I)alamin adenosyltransferase
MTSIATKHGDRGQTSLIGGTRVSKSSLRVEAYGTVDELNSAIGFARSICDDQSVCESALKIQRELFNLGASLATPADARKSPLPLSAASLDALTAEVHALENSKEIKIDWSVPGGSPASAAFDMARTICRRAERCVVRLSESEEAVEPLVLSYLNRLSDLLWLFGRKLDGNSADQSLLRTLNRKQGPGWSRAW